MVARADFVDSRGPAEFTHADHQRRFQQPALVKIVEQRRKHPVEKRRVPVGDQAEVIGVRIPPVVGEWIKHFNKPAPVDLHIGYASLDEPAAQQAALAERGLTVRGSGRCDFAGEVEGRQSLRAK